MATPREHAQSVMAALVLVQNASDEELQTPGVPEMLKDMDDIASEISEVLS
jgi:hypothetical protein